MNVAGVANRVRSGDVAYALGRFRTVRLAYGCLRRGIEAVSLSKTGTRREPARSSLFAGADATGIVETIRKEAVFVGLNLPRQIVEEIRTFALSEPLHAIYDPNGPTFHYSDVRNGIARDGRPMPIGGISKPERCPAVRTVINDPVLLSIVRGYLGHKPRTIKTILDWSFGSAMTDQERRRLKHHVIDYHYDVAGFDFLYASFYINDTDRYSGAHVMIKGSHRAKPWRMLLGSTQADQAAVYRVFGQHNEIVIEGPAGTGFVQDTSCFHRASPPTRGDRLMLAVRFIN